MDIAFCTDANYAPYTGVAMTSIILNNIGEFLRFHVLYKEMNPDDYEKISSLEKIYRNVEIRFYQPDENATPIKDFPINFYYSRVMYWRWLIPFVVLDPSIERIFYLDGDIICRGSLKELFELDLGNYPVGAIGEKFYNEQAQKLKLKSGLGFSSGVMLMDLDEWRKQQITERCFQIMYDRSSEFSMMDNDAIVAVIDGNFLQLDHKFMHVISCHVDFDYIIKPEDVIVHYISGYKPWRADVVSENKDLWWEYARKSPWADMKPFNDGVVLYQNYPLKAARWLRSKGRYEESTRFFEVSINVLMHVINGISKK